MTAGQERHDARNIFLKIVTTLLWCSAGVQLLAVEDRRETGEQLLEDVVRAVELTTAFFTEDYSSINVDGLFGIRIFQGNVIQSLEMCSSPKSVCPDGLVKRLEKIKETISEMTEKAMPYIEEQDPKYFKTFLETIDSPYLIKYIPKRLEHYISEPGIHTEYNEQRGDDCYARLYGTYSDNDRTYPRCTITDGCWKYMTAADTSGYVITHQLIYFLFVKKAGCLDEFDEYVRLKNMTSVKEVENSLCGKIYAEASRESTSGTVNILQQDLFLEQTLVCGILGFDDFLSRKWIRMVLSWQTARGCYSMPSDIIYDRLNEKIEYLKKLRPVDPLSKLKVAEDIAEIKNMFPLDHLNNLKTEEPTPQWRRRNLMRDRLMKGDCLAHKTGLAFGDLGLYVRYLIRELYNIQ